MRSGLVALLMVLVQVADIFAREPDVENVARLHRRHRVAHCAERAHVWNVADVGEEAFGRRIGARLVGRPISTKSKTNQTKHKRNCTHTSTTLNRDRN